MFLSSPFRLLREFGQAAWHRARMPGTSFRGPLPPSDAPLRALAADLQRHVRMLSETIGERNVRHRPTELAQTADYIESEFHAAGLEVLRQTYPVDGVACQNLEVELAGSEYRSEIVIIGAHYDSVPNCPAANDNGSGVAALLALARSLQTFSPWRTLRFVAFVNEEMPYAHGEQMGSLVYARRCRARREDVRAMLSLETIGYYRDEPGSQRYPPLIRWLYPSRGNFIGFVGNTRHAQLVRQVVGAFRRAEMFPAEGGALPESLSDIARSDHWAFWKVGYPALMVTDTANFRYPYYHTPDDKAEKLDFDRTARVVRGLEHVVRELCEGGGLREPRA